MVSLEKGLPSNFHPGKKIRRRQQVTFEARTGNNIKWISQLGGKTYSSPVIADGRLYIGTNDDILDDDRFEQTQGGLLRCLNAEDGSLIWQLVVPRLDVPRAMSPNDDSALVSEDFDALDLGICSTPTVDGDRVYVVSNRCEVLCLDVAGQANGNDGPFKNEAIYSTDGIMIPLRPGDGDILWRFDMLRDIPNFPHDAANCCILVHGDYLYVGTANGVSFEKVVRPEAPALIVLDKHTGELVARDDTFIAPNLFHGQWSSPSLATVNGKDLVIYGGGDGRCYAFEALMDKPTVPGYLNEIWSFDANPERYRKICPTTGDYWDVAVRGRRGEFPDGKVISPSEIIATPVVHDNRVYVTIGQDPLHGRGSGALSCYDATLTGDITKTGLVWQYTDIGRSMATVSIMDGVLYIAETRGKVHCLDAVTGKLYWVAEINADTWGSTLVADGKIYIGTRRGLTVLTAGREGGKHLADVKLSTRVPASPVVANGVLYVTSRRNLFAVQEKAELPLAPGTTQ
jgi:outer membrane protein assembly factor BamB